MKGPLLKISMVVLTLLSFHSFTYSFNLPDTGQTKCYQAVSPYTEISCSGTGQNGDNIINPMSYTDNGNGTVTDNNTGLMWQKCSAGQNNDNACSGTASEYNWYQATGTVDATYNPSGGSYLNICGSLTLGGHTGDWRLPTKKELVTIVDYSIPSPGPTINTVFFPNIIAYEYWLSTMYSDPNFAWYVYFRDGLVYLTGKSSPYYVRCVRGGQ